MEKEIIFTDINRMLRKIATEVTANDKDSTNLDKQINETLQIDQQFISIVDGIWYSLMEIEISLHERIEEANSSFGDTIQDMVNDFIENAQSLFAQVRDAGIEYFDGLQEIVLNFLTIKSASNDVEGVPQKLREV